jgi:purine-binding chemotaxis protein CheW
MSASTLVSRRATSATSLSEYVTFRLADQWLGIPVGTVQEVLVAQRIARVPLAPDAVAGFLNLRGQIVTAIELRTTLGLPARDADEPFMNVVVRQEGELFAFMVDDVGDVLAVDDDAIENTPATLNTRWRSACEGIVRREHDLLLILDVHAFLRLDQPTP